jgi:hypothetical protein
MSILKEKYQKDVVKALKATGKYPSRWTAQADEGRVNMAVNAQWTATR